MNCIFHLCLWYSALWESILSVMVHRRHIICARCNEFKRGSPNQTLKWCNECWIATGQRETDECARRRRTFPFFRLPYEIREMIYQYVFLSPSQDRIIKPDPFRLRRGSYWSRDFETLNVGIGLLATCQQLLD